MITRFILKIETDGENNSIQLPENITLEQNYPNPFNPSTIIPLALPEPADVILEVYNIIGQRVAILVNRNLPAGYHDIRFDADRLSSGIYFYRLTAAGSVITRKMTLLK